VSLCFAAHLWVSMMVARAGNQWCCCAISTAQSLVQFRRLCTNAAMRHTSDMAVTHQKAATEHVIFKSNRAQTLAKLSTKCIFQLCEICCAMCMCATHLMVCTQEYIRAHWCQIAPAAALSTLARFAALTNAGVEHLACAAHLDSLVRAGSSSLIKENTDEPIRTKMNSPTRKEPCC
jgi:hypothetical protein